MLTFHPILKIIIYLLTFTVSTFIGIQLSKGLCLENCHLQGIIYVGISNLIFLCGVILLLKLSEKSISEWNEEE